MQNASNKSNRTRRVRVGHIAPALLAGLIYLAQPGVANAMTAADEAAEAQGLTPSVAPMVPNTAPAVQATAPVTAPAPAAEATQAVANVAATPAPEAAMDPAAEGYRRALVAAYNHHVDVIARLAEARNSVDGYKSQAAQLESEKDRLKEEVVQKSQALQVVRGSQEERVNAIVEAYEADLAPLTEKSLATRSELDENGLDQPLILPEEEAERQAKITEVKSRIDALEAEKKSKSLDRDAKIAAVKQEVSQAESEARAAEMAFAQAYKAWQDASHLASKADRNIALMSSEEGPAAQRYAAAREAYAVYGDPDTVLPAIQ